MGHPPLMGPGFLLVEGSLSHSDTPHSVGLLWTRNEPAQGTLPDNTQQSKETDFHDSGGIQTSHHNKLTAVNAGFRPRGNRNVLECNATDIFQYKVTKLSRGILNLS